LAIGKWKEK
jgi:hypothetical protein